MACSYAVVSLARSILPGSRPAGHSVPARDRGERRGVQSDATETIVTVFMTFLSAVFLVLQMFFWGQGDSHMVTLMCGLCLMCCGVAAGWRIAGKRRGGDGK